MFNQLISFIFINGFGDFSLDFVRLKVRCSGKVLTLLPPPLRREFGLTFVGFLICFKSGFFVVFLAILFKLYLQILVKFLHDLR